MCRLLSSLQIFQSLSRSISLSPPSLTLSHALSPSLLSDALSLSLSSLSLSYALSPSLLSLSLSCSFSLESRSLFLTLFLYLFPLTSLTLFLSHALSPSFSHSLSRSFPLFSLTHSISSLSLSLFLLSIYRSKLVYPLTADCSGCLNRMCDPVKRPEVCKGKICRTGWLSTDEHEGTKRCAVREYTERVREKRHLQGSSLSFCFKMINSY